MSALPNFVEVFAIIFLGLVLGSFSSALAYRVPRNIPWLFKGKSVGGVDGYRSACPSCKIKLKPWDLLPLFSWLFQRGRCRYCSEAIPVDYPLIELAVLGGCLGVYFVYGLSVSSALIMIAIPFLVALLAIDLHYFILPNLLVFITGFLGAAYWFINIFIFKTQGFTFVAVEYVLGAFVYAFVSWFMGFFMAKILRKEALGFGDVKFFAVAGLWLGLSNLALFCVLSGVLGVLFAMFWRLFTKNEVFPFGPALIVSLYILFLVQGSLFL